MKNTALFLIIILLCSCSPKLKSNIIKTIPELSKNELVVVLDISESQPEGIEKIGEIKATDNGLSQNCTYFQNIQNLKALARAAGANLIKITKQKKPDKWSTCHRLWASIYKVNDAKSYETEIEWSVNRKLTWDDFKGQPDLEAFPNTLALTSSGFGYESAANIFKDGKLFIRSTFNNYQSWVVPEGRTDYVLRHEQIHFDITEIYSRILRKKLADSKITTKNTIQAETIFRKTFDDLEKRQNQYDNETKLGLEKETQENWEAIVKIELAKYDLFKNND